ncbi:uncharacterized protein VTP21DRAFT_3210 [Calcarisporiella thermophila]|uniref:uncharacterized protein n=1 Tax=Calcarisporiella thermophila TaxID=911321 RepID=UPI003743E192
MENSQRSNFHNTTSTNGHFKHNLSLPPKEILMQVRKSPSNSMALSNYVYVAPSDFDRRVQYIVVDEQYIFTICPNEQIQPGTLAFSNPHRKWAGVSLMQEISVQTYDPLSENDAIYIGNMELEVGFLARNSTTMDPFDTKELAQAFCSKFYDQIFSIGQSLAFEFKGINLAISVIRLSLFNALDHESTENQAPKTTRPKSHGIITQKTAIKFVRAPSSNIRLTGPFEM